MMIFDRTIEHLYARHRLDIGLADLASAALACIGSRAVGDLAADIEQAWSGTTGFVCLSARSGFDALLSALAYPAGDELAVSAVTHPDMIRIIEAHGLRAVPIDLDLASLAPPLDLLERALSPRTRAVMVVHLFGGRVDLGPIADRLARTGILLIEDCAQSLRGPRDTGDPRSDVALFSFGMIKTATALGGALVRCTDPDLQARVRAVESRWPVQSRFTFARKVATATLLHVAAAPPVFAALVAALSVARRDPDAVLSGSVRGFPSDPVRFFRRIRQRPSRPLLGLLHRRLRRFDGARLARRAAIGERLAKAIAPPLEQPGRTAADRTHWLFPVVAPAPAPTS